MKGEGGWLSWLVLAAGFSGSYFALRALAYLAWFQDFVLVVVLLGLVGLVLGVTIYGFLLLGGLSGGSYLIVVGVACIVVGVGGWFYGDAAFLVVFIVAGLLFSSISIINNSWFSRSFHSVSRVLAVTGLVVILLYVLPLILPVFGSILSGWGMKPVFNGDKVYVPVPLGYRSLSVGEAVRSIVVNGSQVILQLFDGSIIRGIVERISGWILWVATSLGSLVIDLGDFSGRVDFVSAPTPTVAPATSGPPKTVLSLFEISSSLGDILSSPLLIVIDVAYGFVLVAVGLLYMGREV